MGEPDEHGYIEGNILTRNKIKYWSLLKKLQWALDEYNAKYIRVFTNPYPLVQAAKNRIEKLQAENKKLRKENDENKQRRILHEHS